ncbi:hypothetical protein ACFQ8T_17675, partial [Isoptericola sp. NPDC056618]|uniref:hypothetical protein n=1 Tax=Isoptericola sp. NPDC056618 TaxID=3345878 RepID=UPI003675E9DB
MARTVAEHLVDQLVAAGVKRIYGIVGDSLNPVVGGRRPPARRAGGGGGPPGGGGGAGPPPPPGARGRARG